MTRYTRSMSNQMDSCLDHCWTNCSNKIVRHFNEIMGESDHNLIGMDIATGNTKLGCQNIRKRNWKKFKSNEFKKLVSETVWTDILDMEEVDTANSALEDRLRNILDTMTPMITVQTRTKYNKWISDSTKLTMAERDKARSKARNSGEICDWNSFRILRNKCTELQRKDRQTYLKSSYDKIEVEKDPAKLFATTRSLLGWNRATPPDCFLVAVRSVNKQIDVANTQANFYTEKIRKLRTHYHK